EIRAFVISVIREEFGRPASNAVTDKALLERMIRVEEELKHIHKRFDENREYQEKRFEAINKRFEEDMESQNQRFAAIDKRFEETREYQKQLFDTTNKRFEENQALNKELFKALDKRLDKMDKNMKWLTGSGLAFLSILITVYQFLAN
ncbi:MAG TPA: hypothetical protein ACFCUD_06260, partial [Cyclobacteriaceae bacterium]